MRSASGKYFVGRATHLDQNALPLFCRIGGYLEGCLPTKINPFHYQMPQCFPRFAAVIIGLKDRDEAVMVATLQPVLVAGQQET